MWLLSAEAAYGDDVLVHTAGGDSYTASKEDAMRLLHDLRLDQQAAIYPRVANLINPISPLQVALASCKIASSRVVQGLPAGNLQLCTACTLHDDVMAHLFWCHLAGASALHLRDGCEHRGQACSSPMLAFPSAECCLFCP